MDKHNLSDTQSAEECENNITSSRSNDVPVVKDAVSPKELISKFALTDSCHHYTSLGEIEWDIQKYWCQRYSIFSLYDKGIHLTDDSWFSVTPEPIANQVARDLVEFTSPRRKVLIDMFSGAGGNVIAFALTDYWDHIIAIEKDASELACAYHNATIYNVQNKVTWVHGDSFEYFSSHDSSIVPWETVIFASPPWGGPSYQNHTIFDLNAMKPYSLNRLYEVCKKMDTALYLPRTSDLRQIAYLAPEGKKIEVVQYCMEGASKALVAYIPALNDL